MEGGVVNICSKGGKRTVENQRWPQGPERNDSYCPSDFIPSYFSFFFKLFQFIISFWYATPAFENIVRRGERGCPNAHPHIQSKPHFDKKVKFKGKKFFTTLKEFQNFTESQGFQKNCKFDQTLISDHSLTKFHNLTNKQYCISYCFNMEQC